MWRFALLLAGIVPALGGCYQYHGIAPAPTPGCYFVIRSSGGSWGIVEYQQDPESGRLVPIRTVLGD